MGKAPRGNQAPFAGEGEKMKHVVCFSGGLSSALVAAEVVHRFGPADTILLNHDIHPAVEDADIKRFKREVASALGVRITYANMPGWDTKDQFDVCVEAGAFKVGNGTALCTNRMKTKPFMEYLRDKFPNKDCIIYYGFDANEGHRIQRRSSFLGALGYRSDYPLAFWAGRKYLSAADLTFTDDYVYSNTVKPPCTYSQFKHANCIGCLKAKKQHWYVVYCTRKDLWAKAMRAEDEIGYSIQPEEYLADLDPLFSKMLAAGIMPTEHVQHQTFWADVRKKVNAPVEEQLELPCECWT